MYHFLQIFPYHFKVGFISIPSQKVLSFWTVHLLEGLLQHGVVAILVTFHEKLLGFRGILQKLGRYNPKKNPTNLGGFSWSLNWCQVMTSEPILNFEKPSTGGQAHYCDSYDCFFFLKKHTETTLPETNSKWIPWENRPNPLKKKKFHLPTINFQGRSVTFREGITCFGGKPAGIKKPTWRIIPVSK